MLNVLAWIGLATGAATAPVDSTNLRRENLMAALRSGGYTIVLRHARTDRSYQEEVATVPVERIKQRNLSPEGVLDARLMGVVLAKYRIPIGEIISSPMYRARETAEMAVGVPAVTMVLRTFPTTTEPSALLAIPPKQGTNRLLVTHHFVIEAHIPGIRPGDIGESEAAVIRPTASGGVELVGRITLSDWEALANPSNPAPAGAATAPSTGGGHGAQPSPAFVHGSMGPVTTTTPDTRVGRLARAYLAAFNSGKEDIMLAFIESALLPDPDRSPAVRAQSYRRQFEEHGAFAITNVLQTDESSIVIDVSSRRGRVILTARLVEAASGRGSVSLGIPVAGSG